MITLYVVNCKTAKHFYVGISTDPWRRLKKHANGTAAKFTKTHGLSSFRMIREFEDETAAKLAERQLTLELAKDPMATVYGAGWTHQKAPSS